MIDTTARSSGEQCPNHGPFRTCSECEPRGVLNRPRRTAYLSFVRGFGAASAPDRDTDEMLEAANAAFDVWWERIGRDTLT